MDTARCYKCGFTMRGTFRKGPPKACPVCGFTRSKEVLERLKEQKKEAEDYSKKGLVGKAIHNVVKAFTPKPDPIV